MDSPFGMLKEQWLNKMKSAREQKKEFTRDGDECMKFFAGPYSFMYGLKDGVSTSGGDFVFAGTGSAPRPSVAMTVNKVAEAVQIFGPVLYHRNPVRTVNARIIPMLPIELFGDPQDPNVQQGYEQLSMQVKQQKSTDKARAALLKWYLDYTPTATDLKTECREAIDEALIKGMGVLWPQLWTPPTSQMRIVASCYDTVDNLLIDGDMESRKHAKWVAKICTKPVWEFESLYGIPHGTIKQGSSESLSTRDTIDDGGGAGEMARRQGKTNDLITYYEVYSKMGMGPLMTGADWTNETKELDRFGQYTYLVICKELNYPANIPPQIWTDDQAIGKAVQWPCPYWSDDCWPFAEIAFHDVPKQTWPMSHFKPAMGELKFLNWAYSFLASRMKKSARDLLVVAKSASEEMRRALVSGEDFELVALELSHGKTIKEIVEVLQFPEINNDMFKVIEAVTHLFEQRTGLSELMYGETAHQYRSAAEADVKQSQLHVRPDDMNNKVEDWMTNVARMEALTARWLLEPERDIQPIGGQIYAAWWGQYITPSDPTEVLHQIEYRVEAGSTKKPNKDKEVADANDAMQSLFQPMFTVAMQMSHMNPAAMNPVNALITMWADAHELDPSPFLIPPPPPPPPPPPDQPKISLAIDFATLDPELQKSFMVMAGVMQESDQVTGPLAVAKPGTSPVEKAQDMVHKEAAHNQDLRHATEAHKQDMKIAQAKAAAARAQAAKKKP